MSGDPIRLFVFGLGFSATAFARSLRGQAAWIGGTVRTAAKAAALRAEGFDALVFDGDHPGPHVRAALGAATHLLASVPPRGDDDPVLRHHRADILAAPDLAWIGYLSTVGVYGDHRGDWVDEETPPNPRRGRSSERLASETAWTSLAKERATPLGVFRIAGIYGPGRNALVSLAEGRAHRVIKPGQVFNRIHTADIADTLRAATGKPASRIYNVADDEPAPPQDVVAYAARLMDVAPPPAVAIDAAELTPMARSFYEDNKRVSNRRIREELGVRLRYPTYRDGLDALWRDGNWRG